MSFDVDTEFAGRKIVEFHHEKPVTEDLSQIAIGLRCGDEDYDGDTENFPDDVGYEGAIEYFANQPIAAEVESLAVGMLGGMGDENPGHMDTLLKAIKAGKFPKLRHLFVGNIAQWEAEVSWIEMGDICDFLDALPQLETFKARAGGSMSAHPIIHTGLKTLILESGSLHQPLVQAIAACTFPALTHLELWPGTPQYQGIEDIAPLRPIFSGERLPSLKHLAIRNCEFSDELAMALTHAPIVSQLDVLDLSYATMTDRGAEALARGSEKLAHLRKLDLSRNFLTPASDATLKTLRCEVDTSQQNQMEDWGDGPHAFVPVSE